MNALKRRLHGSEILQSLASSSLVILARVGGNIATLVYTLLVVRLLTPAEFGAVSSLWSLSVLLVPLATLNLAPIAVQVVVKARQEGNDALAAGFIRFARRVALVGAPCVMLIFLALVWARFPSVLDTALVGVLLLALSIAGMSQVQTGAAVGVALDRAATAQVPRELIRPILLVVLLGGVIAMGGQLSVSGALALYAGTVVAEVAAQYYLFRGALAFTKAQRPVVDNPVNWIKTGFFLLPARLVNDNAKMLMIVAASAVLSLEQVALITVAISLSGLLNFAIASVEISFSAKISRALHAAQRPRVDTLHAVGGAIKLVLCLSAVIVVLLVLEPVLALFGRHYVAGGAITLTLMAIPVIRALFGKADLVLLVHGLRSRIFWTQLPTLLLIPCGALLLPLFPQRDPALLMSVGFVFAYGVGIVSMWWIALRQTGIDTSLPGSMRRALHNRKADRGVAT